MIGEPDAGKPHVRFDEGTQETGGDVPRPRSTLPRRPCWEGSRKLNEMERGEDRFGPPLPIHDSWQQNKETTVDAATQAEHVEPHAYHNWCVVVRFAQLFHRLIASLDLDATHHRRPVNIGFDEHPLLRLLR